MNQSERQRRMDEGSMVVGIRRAVKLAHHIARSLGWDGVKDPPTDIALMHSELSEGLEYLRKGGMEAPSEKIEFTGIEEELADVLIRIFHFAGKHDLDLAEAVAAKMRYNEGRDQRHGKRF